MRRILGLVVAGLVVAGGCTSGSDEEEPTSSSSAEVSLSSLDLGWPEAEEQLAVTSTPPAPKGFDATTYDRMADTLIDWAQVTTVDDAVRRGGSALDAVAEVLPDPTARTLRKQVKAAVSPRLAVANVFADDVTVLGAPQVTTAWQVSKEDDEDGKPYVRLELQTRAAYEVRTGEKGPKRVIGVLRVHGLSAYADTTDDFGVSGGWQEFGAGDCALAVDDELVPDADLEQAEDDLVVLRRVGDTDDVEMPDLGDDEQVDADYLERCRAGQV